MIVVSILQIAVIVWMTRALYSNYGRADHSNRTSLAPAVIVWLLLVGQILEVAKDPSNRTDWAFLGLQIVCSMLMVVQLVVRRRRHAAIH